MIEDEKFVIKFTSLILDESHYFLPKYAYHRPAVKSLLRGVLHEPSTHKFVQQFCKSFAGSIIHAGTFFGDMIPNFSKFVNGKVYAFEPVLENYILAKLSIDKNNLKNVVLMNSALSLSIGNLLINTNGKSGKHAGGTSRISNKGLVCSSINIDCLDIKDLVLIQLDLEGHELMALRGAKKTINVSRPLIAIENGKKNCEKFLRKTNYEIVGKIPGLEIWTPIENNSYKDIAKSLVNI